MILALSGLAITSYTKDTRLLGNAWLALGTASNLMEQFVPALAILEQAQRLFAQQNDVLGIARCQWQRGIALRFQNHLDESIELFQKAISALEKQGTDFELACVQRDLAMAYNLVEDFDNAGMMVETARAFFQSRNYVIQAAICDLVNGARLRHLTRYQEALEVLKNAQQTFQSADRPIEQGRALFMIGLIYIQLQKYDQALLYQQKTHQIFSSIGLPLRVAYCRLALGRIASSSIGYGKRLGLVRAKRHGAIRLRLFAQLGECGIRRGRLLSGSNQVRARSSWVRPVETRNLYSAL